MSDPTRRFTNRVADYAAARPSYPRQLVQNLFDHAGLSPGMRVADVGSGTGISGRLFLDAGLRVAAVEPNEAMREAAERELGGREGFESVAGTAERTTLADASRDLVAAGQAFHWFDRDAAIIEFARILRPGGHVCLFWNGRDDDADDFMRGYAAIVRDFETDRRANSHRDLGDGEVARLLGDLRAFRFPNAHRLDRVGLRRVLWSASYLPTADTDAGRAMGRRADELFDAHADGDGRVTVRYTVTQHLGRPRAS